MVAIGRRKRIAAVVDFSKLWFFTFADDNYIEHSAFHTLGFSETSARNQNLLLWSSALDQKKGSDTATYPNSPRALGPPLMEG